MKRSELVKIVEAHLEDFGFIRGSWVWQPRSSELLVVLNQGIKTIKLRSNMTKKALIFEMGRLAGLAEAAGLVPPQPKTDAKPKRVQAKAQYNGSGAMAMGMPA